MHTYNYEKILNKGKEKNTALEDVWFLLALEDISQILTLVFGLNPLQFNYGYVGTHTQTSAT